MPRSAAIASEAEKTEDAQPVAESAAGAATDEAADAPAAGVDETGVVLSLDLQQAHSDPTKVVCGYLQKRGDSFTAFKDRYVVLDGGVLSYYTKETDYDRKAKPKKDRAIPLKYYAVARGPIENKAEDGQLNFQLVPIVSREEAAEVGLPGSKKSKLRVFVFRAAKEGDRDDWMRCFFAEECHTENELRAFLDAQTFKDLRVPEGEDPCERLRLARDGPIATAAEEEAAAAAAAAAAVAVVAGAAVIADAAAAEEPAAAEEEPAAAEAEAPAAAEEEEPAATEEEEPAATEEAAAAAAAAAAVAVVAGAAVIADAAAEEEEPAAAEEEAPAAAEEEAPAAAAAEEEPTAEAADGEAAEAEEADAVEAEAAASSASAADTEAAAASTSEPKTGKMMKKGETNAKWDMRGLRLEAGKLTYLKNGKKAKSKRNPIDVTTCSIVPPALLQLDAATRARVSAKKQLTLEQEADKTKALTEEQTATFLVLAPNEGGGKALYLDAESAEERDEWAAAILAQGSAEAETYSA
jgi:hypothetical protein